MNNGASSALDVLRGSGMRISTDRPMQDIGGFSVEKDGQQIAVFMSHQGERALERAIAVKGTVVVLVDPRSKA